MNAPTRIDQKPGEIITNSLGIQMAWIPRGSFLMGSPEDEGCRDDRETQHGVALTKGFYIGIHQVTQGHWQKVMGGNPSFFREGNNTNRPVETVTWYDAVAFCNLCSLKEEKQPYYEIANPDDAKICINETYRSYRLNYKIRKADVSILGGDGYRLPTEAEWEYACRAGTATTYYFGDDPASLADYGWYYKNRSGEVQAVGKKRPNGWGIYDMHGNIWEWCNDKSGEYVQPIQTSTMQPDPQGPSTGEFYVMRGGCWTSNADALRCARRGSSLPSYCGPTVGLRICCFRN